MTIRFLQFKSWSQIYTYRQVIKGFTLIELLVAVLVATFAVSGLLTMVIRLLQTDQRESAQSETQQQIQMALDFIREDLREAVYVYDGKCLQTGGSTSCPNLANYIPASTTNSAPILAFWKLQPFPQQVQALCASTNPPLNTNCSAGKSYSLVIYYLRQNQSTDAPQWQGPARITRYQLTQFDSNGNSNAASGYVDPTAQGTSFQNWPQGTGQTLPSRLSGNPDTLVDSVDFTTSQTLNCPTPYVASPANGATSFYSCVRTASQPGTNQDIWLFLTGNASGKPGLNNNNFRPTLQTDVILRSVLNKIPFS